MQPSPSVTTIERFILDQERRAPNTSSGLSDLLYDLALAAKIISRQVRRAGLTDILGGAGSTNSSGEQQQKLDVFARDAIHSAVQYSGSLCLMASEEDDEPVHLPPDAPVGSYVLFMTRSTDRPTSMSTSPPARSSPSIAA